MRNRLPFVLLVALIRPTVSGAQVPPAVTVAIASPSAGATVTGNTTVTATTSGPGATLVAGVRFTLDGANLGQEATAAPYNVPWDTAASGNGSHTLVAVARDLAGITYSSDPVTLTVYNNLPYRPADTAVRFENTEPSIAYTPGTTAPGQPPDWWHGSRSRGWSAGTASFNRSSGARAAFTFTGSSIRWIGFLAYWAGIANVYLDGAFVSQIDLYVPDERPQSTVFSRTGLPPGTHTIVVESTGMKNASAADYAVVVDAFDVGPSAVPPADGTRVDETAASVAYTSGWGTDRSIAWSGGSAAASRSPTERATLTFTGTRATWLGVRGPDTGYALVYLDGAFQAEIDTYSPVEVQAPIYQAGNLAPGRHTLAIQPMGFARTGATDSLVFIDAFDVRSRFEDGDASIQYSTAWALGETRQAFSGTSTLTGTGTAATSSTAGNQATFSFAGTAVTWIGAPGPSRGIARLYVDGVFAADVDTYAAADQVRAAVFTANGLADATHTLTIEVTGTRNAASTGTSIVLDAFDVVLPTSAPAVGRLQESDPSIANTTGWDSGPIFQFWSGGRAMSSSTPGAQATFTFTGRNVRWLGDRSFSGGYARVYLDGVLATTVDTHAPLQEEYQTPLFIATDLPPGTHTLTIEATGTAAPGSSGVRVVIDAFEVY
jgi:hypothetical protein